MDHTEKIKAEILAVGCSMLDKGLIAGTWGNISARIPGTQFIAVTPSGRGYRELTIDDVVVVDEMGTVIEGGLKPSSELPLHIEIYQARFDVQAIVHTHSVFASACAVAHKGIPPIIEDLVQLVGGGVDVAAYALPGTERLAKNVVAALSIKNAVLMANHGVVGCGQSLTEAMMACELVEKAAQILIYANQLGGAQVLSDEDVEVMHKFYVEYYRQRQQGRKI
ncbi:class II aldolase/adducin family protein [Pelosinus sp. sgz500959]|uniref:class II aldolase/adducin family protein n=1 Tax=Pelosinus sp. sgz500959 TaxID=3242472 RepID=UPI00366AFBDE